CLTLAVDESAEQTERIHRVQRERRTLAGLLAHEQRKDLLKTLRNAQRLLQPLHVVNPYAPALTFATARTRNRRDHEKYLTLIDAIALLHQHQREIKTLPAGPSGAGSTRFIEVTLDDIALANQLAPEVLGRSLDELPPQTRRLLGFIREVLKRKAATGGAKVGPGTAWFTRKELREHCGWSLTQIRVHLERLVELEYLATRHARLNNQSVYEPLFDVDVPETIAQVGLIDVESLATAHSYTAHLAGFERRLAGQNGQLTGVGGGPPPT
ncbi:MAG: DNA primase, partial [Acidobacteria bacterium]|nr:DNA primase [Acidobacteriota bacterium]